MDASTGPFILITHVSESNELNSATREQEWSVSGYTFVEQNKVKTSQWIYEWHTVR